MSNYNSLKTTIDANIKQNGNQEITGQILNSVLNQMVNILGTGYQFAGIATIDTNPGTPDAKVFYIANGKGTYEKFGGINVTEDDVVVLYWDSSWHKVATGIASQAKLSELKTETNKLKVSVFGGEHYTDVSDTFTWIDNKAINARSDGKETSSSIFKASDRFYLDGVTRIKISLPKRLSTDAGLCVYASTGMVIKSVFLSGAAENGKEIVDIDIPANASYLRTTYYMSEEFGAFCCKEGGFKERSVIYKDDVSNNFDDDENKVLGLGAAKTLKNEIDFLGKNLTSEVIYGYDEVVGNYFEKAYLIDAQNSIGKTYSSVTKVYASDRKGGVFKIDVNEGDFIEYPMFKTSSGYGSLITDKQNVVIAQYYNSTMESGTINSIVVPAEGKYVYIGLTGSLETQSLKIKHKYINTNSSTESVIGCKLRFLPYLDTFTEPVEDSMCLGAIKFEFKPNCLPFQRGYLFHKTAIGTGNELYYSTSLNGEKQLIGIPNFNPRDYVLNISPKHGIVLAVKRDARQSIMIFDGTTTTSVNAKTTEGQSPKGWLYNSGCEFGEDENGNEYVLFAEYDGSVSDGQKLNIWKGVYPYTSPENWKVVFSKTSSYNSGKPSLGSLTHFHMIRKDPWSGLTYTTTGDFTGQFMWAYSADNGENWTELATDYNNANKPSWVLDGQPLRCINFIFTKDWIYFATDHGSNNTLSRIKRDESGLIDINTREILADLPYGQAINSLCYCETPNGLFMYGRIDTGFTSCYKNPIQTLFWSFRDNKLHNLLDIKQVVENWGGHRGKCYLNYTNGQESSPAMGFAGNTRCGLDFIGTSENIGTIYYEIVE